MKHIIKYFKLTLNGVVDGTAKIKGDNLIMIGESVSKLRKSGYVVDEVSFIAFRKLKSEHLRYKFEETRTVREGK